MCCPHWRERDVDKCLVPVRERHAPHLLLDRHDLRLFPHLSDLPAARRTAFHSGAVNSNDCHRQRALVPVDIVASGGLGPDLRLAVFDEGALARFSRRRGLGQFRGDATRAQLLDDGENK